MITREELIALGQKIVTHNGTEEELRQLMDTFDHNVPHPKGCNLFFWPEKFDARKGDISKYNPTVEEVVDKCLSYKPIIL